MQYIGTRNIALIIIALAIISTVLIFKTDGNPQRIFSNENLNLITESVQKNRDTDTDGDTIPDWQELISGTNPNNPNTFNVEGGDVAYIEAQKQKDPETKEDSMYTNNDNLTQHIARGTLSEYMLRISGDTSTQYRSPEELAASIANQSFLISNPTLYSKQNIKIVNTNKSTLLAYANSLRTIEQTYPSSQFVGIGNAINTALSGSPDQPGVGDNLAKNLAPYLELYKQVLHDMLAVPVPDTFVNEHINLINSTEGARFNLEQLTKLDTDPARALLGAQLFPEYLISVEQTYELIVHKLNGENIPL